MPGKPSRRRPQPETVPITSPGSAQARHSASRAAQASGDDGTTQSSDWMAERIMGGGTPDAGGSTQAAQEGPAPQGVPIDTAKHDTSQRGKTVESRRGSHR
jgi:hypothetical protein